MFGDVIPMLRGVPIWVTWLAMGWLVYTIMMSGILLFVDRSKSALLIDIVRSLSVKGKGLALEVKGRNNTTEAVQLDQLQLEFWGSKKPKGGLQSSTSSETHVIVVYGEATNGYVRAKAKGSEYTYAVEVRTPFVGQDYLMATIPLVPSIRVGEPFRLVVQLGSTGLVNTQHRHIAVQIVYNDGLRTATTTRPFRTATGAGSSDPAT